MVGFNTGWALARRADYARRLPCALDVRAASEFAPATYAAVESSKRPKRAPPPEATEFAKFRDAAVVGLLREPAETARCRAALAAAGEKAAARRPG